MPKQVPPIDEWAKERIAGIAFAFIRGGKGMTLSKTCKTLAHEDPNQILEALREYKEGFAKVNEHAFWELVSALGVGEP